MSNLIIALSAGQISSIFLLPTPFPANLKYAIITVFHLYGQAREVVSWVYFIQNGFKNILNGKWRFIEEVAMDIGEELAKTIRFELKKKLGQNYCEDDNTVVMNIARANAESIAAVEPELPLDVIDKKSNDYNSDEIFKQIKEKSKIGKEWRKIILILSGLSTAIIALLNLFM